MAAPVDGAMGNIVDRSRVISGRQVDPSAPDEITVGEGLAASMHLGLGSVLESNSYSPQQMRDGIAGKQVGAPAGPHVRFHVVGVVRRPLDLGVRAASGGVVVMSRAFNDSFGNAVGTYTDVLRVRADSAADVPRVEAAARRVFGRAQTFQEQPLGLESEGARNAIDVLTLTLWIFAGVAALAGAVAITITLSRDITRSSFDPRTLGALGVTRRQTIAAGAARAGIVAVGGAVVAAVVAVVLSPRFPVGIARRADPDLGVHADWVVLALGTATVAATVLAVALVAAWRTARAPAPGHAERRRRASRTVEIASRIGFRPAATSGLRMACEPGRGTSAVPVRSGIAGAVFGIAGVTAVLVFGASLTHLVRSPSLAGWTWNLRAEVPTSANPNVLCVDRDDHGVARVSGVEAVAAVCITSLQIDGRAAQVWGLENLHGDVAPEIVAGHAPRSADEVVLGAATFRAVKKHIGDSVHTSGYGTRTYRVVGRVVFPSVGEVQPLADGALFTADGVRPLLRKGGNESHYLLVKYEPGANGEAIERALARQPQVRNVSSRPDITSVEVGRLGQIDRVSRDPGRAPRDPGPRGRGPHARHIGAAPSAGARAAQDLRVPAPPGGGGGRVAGDDGRGDRARRRHPDRARRRAVDLARGRRQPRRRGRCGVAGRRADRDRGVGPGARQRHRVPPCRAAARTRPAVALREE